MAVEVIKPPQSINNRHYKDSFKIFLAGSIDMGKVRDWQSEVKDFFAPKSYDPVDNRIQGKHITLFNPRREEWDSTWKQDIENPHFYQQVNWELNALEKADLIIVNILPNSKSPITLLEIGLFAQSKKIMICCPDFFYRKGNIEVVCDRYGIPLYTEFDKLLRDIK